MPTAREQVGYQHCGRARTGCRPRPPPVPLARPPGSYSSAAPLCLEGGMPRWPPLPRRRSEGRHGRGGRDQHEQPGPRHLIGIDTPCARAERCEAGENERDSADEDAGHAAAGSVSAVARPTTVRRDAPSRQGCHGRPGCGPNAASRRPQCRRRGLDRRRRRRRVHPPPASGCCASAGRRGRPSPRTTGRATTRAPCRLRRRSCLRHLGRARGSPSRRVLMGRRDARPRPCDDGERRGGIGGGVALGGQ